MNKIVSKKELTPNVKVVEVHAPAVANKAKPGQFVIVRFKETGERIPMTIAGTDPGAGTVTIYLAEVGRSSTELGMLEEGDELLNFAGPLGNAAEIKNYGKTLCVA
ncbi:MAG: sulfide/dihydroorotate dehydrogenase-like FAD/NAD-binding protein, partial [Anaerolineae bacterium]|nr:sulfide/dihydroorotate dehydrogenase-like FAD/NAD-binding protein [Anaerolineae bacterium]NIN98455.1 sulfide/dihydroorotate dehydrogenase-like FAD/NAD-binding protein [Anaerolineae bacterium]NIQ81355.1 sulfide/dihydroorotate dehydrogenase-like FAD/NAD-binding protein [Anaerolineae bacterium]